MVSVLDYLCAYVPIYQDVKAGERCFSNLKEFGIRKVFAIDGRSRLLEGIGNVSTDGTIEVAKSFDNVEVIQFPDKPSIEIRDKHNIAFNKAGNAGYEWMMLLGADEYLTGDLEVGMSIAVLLQNKFRSEHFFNVGFKEHNTKSKYARNVDFLGRLFHNPEHFRCMYTHWTMFYDGVKINPKYFIDVITINADDTIRPDWRNKLMDEYQDRNVPVEHKSLFTAFGDPTKIVPEAYSEHYCKFCDTVKSFFLGRCVNCLNECE